MFDFHLIQQKYSINSRIFTYFCTSGIIIKIFMSELIPRKRVLRRQSYQDTQSLKRVWSQKKLPFCLVKKISMSRQTQASLTNSRNSQQICIQDFELIRKLGKGTYGKVFLAMHKQTGFICAIKIIQKDSLIGPTEQETAKIRNQIIREIKDQFYLTHQNITDLYCIFSDEKNIYLVMEAVLDGHFYNLIKTKGKLSQHNTSYLIKQVLEGLDYMHEKGIIHRDLKLENLLLNYDTVKICDFGWSVHLEEDLRSTVCGTPLYFSPQLLKGQNYDGKIDVWAVGVLTYELITGENPFHIRTKQQIMKIVTNNFVMTEGSYLVRNFIRSALEKCPERRATAKDLLNHPFIKKYEEMQECDFIKKNFS